MSLTVVSLVGGALAAAAAWALAPRLHRIHHAADLGRVETLPDAWGSAGTPPLPATRRLLIAVLVAAATAVALARGGVAPLGIALMVLGWCSVGTAWSDAERWVMLDAYAWVAVAARVLALLAGGEARGVPVVLLHGLAAFAAGALVAWGGDRVVRVWRRLRAQPMPEAHGALLGAALGAGDVVWLGVLGAWLSAPVALVALWLACISALGHGLYRRWRVGDSALPFGVHLAPVGFLVALLAAAHWP